MTNGEPSEPGPSHGPHGPHEPGKSDAAAFRAQVRARRADIERQVQETKAQFDQANEKIRARTGRNLILAIAIGLVFGAFVLASLIFVKEIFMVVAIALVVFASLEIADAFRGSGRNISRLPTVIAAVAMVPAAFYLGSGGLWYAAVAGLVFVVLWRLVEGILPGRRIAGAALLRDLLSAALVQVYVPFLAAFAVLLVAQPNGQWWTLAFVILVIAVDTGAYASGLAFGKHPMAPTISPKKTWEGFAGAAVASIVAGVLLAVFMLNVDWWFGLVFGPVLLLTATLGDLAESLIKRDIGIKDMSSWLPGHGGFLDRLDSILPSAAAAYALYVVFVPLLG
jgi:CDP-diglyceride synthetase